MISISPLLDLLHFSVSWFFAFTCHLVIFSLICFFIYSVLCIRSIGLAQFKKSAPNFGVIILNWCWSLRAFKYLWFKSVIHVSVVQVCGSCFCGSSLSFKFFQMSSVKADLLLQNLIFSLNQNKIILSTSSLIWHSSQDSISALYRGSPGFKSRQGREFFSENK